MIDPLSEKFYNWPPYVYFYNNTLKYNDPNGKQGVLTVPRAAYRTYQVSKLLRYGAVGGGVIAGGAYLSNQEVAKRAEEVGNNLIGAAGITTTATAVTKEQMREQNKRGKLSDVEDLIHKKVTDGLSKGGNNPKIPDGDFKPNPNQEFSKLIKGISIVTGLGVIASQIGGQEDARKDMKEEEKKQEPTKIEPQKKEERSFLDTVREFIGL